MIKSTCYTIIFLISFITPVAAQPGNIKNDVFWQTRERQPINSQGGGIFKFADPKTGQQKYYWYGVHYEEADKYRDDPSITLPNATFKAVTCYSSSDLVNWTFEGDVLSKAEIIKSTRRTWVGRLGVAYIKEMNKYVMFVQHDTGVLIAMADNPTADFKWHQKVSMRNMIGTSNTGDQTIFTDDDTGISYLIYSYGNGRNKIYVSEIGLKEGLVNLLDCTPVFAGESREGNCMFKYKGKFYMAASNIYGWDASLAYYLVADNIRGPYIPKNNMLVMPGCEQDYAHVTQTGFFCSIKGTKQETILYCGDRWANFAGNGLGYNQWFPLSFDAGMPHFNSLSSWNLNAATGEWNVGAENNYVKNGSFEADRKTVPNNFKPIQDALTGWTTTVIKGTAVTIDTLVSPRLNYFNSRGDRRIVTGEKSLNISDKIKFERKVFQVIRSSPFVPLEDGYYDMTASVKNSDGFSQLEMFTLNKGKTRKYAITRANPIWKTISIKRVRVAGGNITIGFFAKGTPNAFCYVDDVSLVKAVK